ncbi:multiple sugar transport system permease protein [Evansella vedderi]|uniref:Multiple sugar transport system permease protein n=1 Tax=Evansella vedderi TaxID=38282 RepID=A0ABU0A203_9BACI|nr:sugar ABC transporter permease [Evansella vedderi]MDQ0256733.1 multiple sugar transport system permease protein [Evansella vedderi]
MAGKVEIGETSTVVKKRPKMKDKTKETWAGILFVSPLIIGTSILVIIPIFMALIVSFTDYVFIRGMGEMTFTGLKNYTRMLTDAQFIKSLVNNLILLCAIPVSMGIALLLATIINKYVYFKSLFRVIYFMPFISSIVAIAVVFQLLFHPSFGPINEFLMWLGISDPPRWLADTRWALATIIIIQIWTGLGFNLIIYLAALQNIPKELYEAADMDGANFWGKFRRITVPMITPTSFFLFMMGIIGSFKSFELIVVLTGGGPNYATSTLVYYIYERAFLNLNSAYAAALSIFLLLFLLVLTIINWYGQKKWVHY